MMNMSKVENLTKEVVLLRLKSGRSMYVGPNTTSEEIEDVELKDNADIQRLLVRGVIAVHPAAAQKPAKRSTKTAPAPAPGKKNPKPAKKTKTSKKAIQAKGGK